MSAIRFANVAAGLALAAGGCATTTSGISGGDVHAPGQPETRPFVQITTETRRAALLPLWLAWNEGWNDWPYWSRPSLRPYESDRFTRFYSGKVVANLRNDGGHHMRCRFHLDNPARGMSGGGLIECPLPGGRSVDAITNRS